MCIFSSHMTRSRKFTQNGVIIQYFGNIINANSFLSHKWWVLATNIETYHSWKNYIILREYIKCVLPPLIEVVGLTMNLISRTHDFCERKEYAFNILLEYSIITLIHVRERSMHLLYFRSME
jgi:hypothetical protein